MPKKKRQAEPRKLSSVENRLLTVTKSDVWRATDQICEITTRNLGGSLDEENLHNLLCKARYDLELAVQSLDALLGVKGENNAA